MEFCKMAHFWEVDELVIVLQISYGLCIFIFLAVGSKAWRLYSWNFRKYVVQSLFLVPICDQSRKYDRKLLIFLWTMNDRELKLKVLLPPPNHLA